TTLSSLTTTDEPVDPRTKYGAKRRHNIVELIETEKEYVKDLALIVEVTKELFAFKNFLLIPYD
ncbi:unnamed protein product, partial [Rotaria magnacalcarata]